MRLKHGFLAIALTALGIGIPYYLDSQIPRATAIVQVHPSSIPFTGLYRSYMESEFDLILSKETLTLAATALDIPADRQDEALGLMQKNIKATPIHGTDFIEITAKFPDRIEAINTANTVALSYAQRRAEMYAARVKKALTALDDELKEQEAIIKNCREKLISLTGDDVIPDFDEHRVSSTPSPVDSGATKTTAQNRADEPEIPLSHYKQAKEAYDQSRIMLREMITTQKEDRLQLLTPHSPVTLHQLAQ